MPSPTGARALVCAFATLLLDGCCASGEALRDRVVLLQKQEAQASEVAARAACVARGGGLDRAVERGELQLDGADSAALRELRERAVYGLEALPPGALAPPAGASLFVTESVSAGWERAAHFVCRTPDGVVTAMRMVAQVEQESVKECGCNPGRGTPEEPPRQVLQYFWLRKTRAEQVSFMDVPFATRRLARWRPGCGGPPVP